MTEQLENILNKNDNLLKDPVIKRVNKYFAKTIATGGVSSIIGYCVDKSYGGDGRAGMEIGFSLGTIIGMIYHAYFLEDI